MIYKYYIMIKASLLDIRNEWAWYLFLMIVTPLSMLLFLHVVARDIIDFSSYIVGSTIMIFGTGVFLGLGQTFSYYKATKALDYYLTLPMPKIWIVLSLLLRNILLSVPSLMVLLFVGKVLYNVKIQLGGALFLAILLTSFSLAGLGTLIGVTSKNMQIASILTQVVTPVITYLAPVFVTPDRLPVVVQYISRIFPTTYAANMLRYSLLHGKLSLDFLILLLISLISIILVIIKVDWRRE